MTSASAAPAKDASAGGCAASTRMPQLDDVARGALFVAAGLWPLSPALKNLALAVAVVAWLLSWWMTQPRRMPHPRATVPLLLWLAAGLCSLPQSIHLLSSLRGIAKVLEEIAIVLATAHVITTSRHLARLAWAMMIGATLASLDGLVQLVRGSDLVYHMEAGIALSGLPRLTAAFHHANDFGVYGASLLPVALVMALSAAPGRRRWLAWGMAALLSVATLWTWSRPAAVGIAGSLVVFLTVRGAWRMLALVGIAALIGVVALPAPIKTWAAQQPSWIDVLAQPERPQMWRTALNMIHAHSVTGVGINTFARNYVRYRQPDDPLTTAYAHNHFLHMAAEIGLVGLAAFGLFLVSTWLVWQRLLTGHDATRSLWAAGVGCGLISFLLVGLLESALYSPHTHLAFWVWAGALHGLDNSDKRPQSTSDRSQKSDVRSQDVQKSDVRSQKSEYGSSDF